MDSKTSRRKSASNATGHFWYQRITSIALIPLSFWLFVMLNKALHVPHAETLAWLTSPINAALIAFWTITAFYHAALGLQVVIEDYVSTIPLRLWSIRAVYLIFSLLGIAALSAIVFILLQGYYGPCL